MRRGFTLLEMTVVLVIIAIVTHLALRSLDSLLDEKRVAAANRQLEEIRAAVFSFDRDGVPTGFLADMGRLTYATNGTLSELWQRPASARDYAVLPAVKANFVKGVDASLAEANVRVATGWRGPYLALPLGKSRLLDPWGNPLESPDEAGFARLSASNDFAVAVTHFGPTALTNDVRRARLSLLPDRGATSRLTVQVVSRSGSRDGTIAYKWFGPCDGLITGAVARAVAYGVPHTFAGLTPGRRVVWDSASGVPRLVIVHPGDNQLEIEVP